jgi:predicted metal-dependent hydrolase
VVAYQHAESAVRIQEQGTTLTIVGNRKDKERIRQALLTWIKKKGRQHLKPWLAEVAEEMQLSYQSISIRLQKGRWGSCSAKKRLNLNAGLLFLPDSLVRHVLIHELTHLKHLNHSASFWLDVEKYDKHYKENRKLLKEYAKDVPAWLSQAFDEALA